MRVVRRGRTGVVLATVALAASLVAGCGAGTEPAAKPSPTGPKTNGIEKLRVDKVIEKATEASAAADTVHVVGGMKDDDADVEIDMKFKEDAGSVGHMLMDGMRIDIIRVDTDVYFKGSKKFWSEVSGNAQVASLLTGKWIKSSMDDESMADLAKSTDPEHLFDDALEENVGKASKGKPEQVDGQLALPLISKDGGKAYIALTGEPRILKIEATEGEGMTFTYDEPVKIKAPPADEIFDPNQ